MVININESYFIETDARNYILKERYMGVDKNEEPKEYIRTEGYFGTVTRALNRVIHLEIDNQDLVKDLEGYIEMLRSLAIEFNELKECAK